MDGIPDFTKSGWRLMNPTSFLLQDLIGMRKVVVEVFTTVLQEHLVQEHGLVGNQTDIRKNLLKKDISNLSTGWQLGDKSVWKTQEST